MSHTSSASASAASDETASAASPAASAAASAAGSDGAAPAADEWSSLRLLLSRRGPWCTADFAPDEEDPLDVVQNSVSEGGRKRTAERGLTTSLAARLTDPLSALL